MKTLSTLLLVAAFPMFAGAAERYTYECENDADGVEGLCIAVPVESKKVAAQTMQDKGRPPKDRSKMIADDNAKTMFKASDVVEEEAVKNQANVPSADAANTAKTISAQEKIRQVEIFLQPTKGAQGGLGTGTSDPTKAGK